MGGRVTLPNGNELGTAGATFHWGGGGIGQTLFGKVGNRYPEKADPSDEIFRVEPPMQGSGSVKKK